MDELQKIDVLRERMKITYAAAKSALDMTGGDLVQALINLERESQSARDQLVERGKQSWEMLKDGVIKASRARVKLKRGEKVLFTLPAPVGALAIVGAIASTQIAVAGLAGTAVALAKKCTLEIDGQSEHNSSQQETVWTPNSDI